MMISEQKPLVSVVMGSDSDLPTMRAAMDVLTEFEIPFEVRILSAHRTPDDMIVYARAAAGRGLKAIIAGAGGAAHLPGMIASVTPLPVIGVPVAITQLAGIDALLSIVQMPGGIPVATVAIGNAKNAGLLAVRILGAGDPDIQTKMAAYQAALAEAVRAKDAKIQREFAGNDD